MTEQLPLSTQLRVVARLLAASYPSVRQHAAIVRAAAERLDQLEGRELLNRFERRATKRKAIKR